MAEIKISGLQNRDAKHLKKHLDRSMEDDAESGWGLLKGVTVTMTLDEEPGASDGKQ